MRLWWLRRQRPRRFRPGPVTGAGHVAHLVQQEALPASWTPTGRPDIGKWPRSCAATVRASSAVECMNSVLRMHQSRHRTLTQGMLDLKRLYWNSGRSASGKRKGKCPYEHLGLKLPSYDFWEPAPRGVRRRRWRRPRPSESQGQAHARPGRLDLTSVKLASCVLGRCQSKPMAMRRKMMSCKSIKLTPPILEAKIEANCEMRIFFATDETRIEHG